jgi:hypothetical protein
MKMTHHDLFEAIEFNNIELIKKNIKSFDNLDCYSKEGLSPLECACLKSNQEIIEILLAHGADYNRFNVIKFCLSKKHEPLLDRFLSLGINHDISNEESTNFLMLACEYQLKKYIDYFISQGINIHQKDKKGRNCIDYLLFHYNPDTKLLNHLLNKKIEFTYLTFGLAILYSNNINIIKKIKKFQYLDTKLDKEESENILSKMSTSQINLDILQYIIEHVFDDTTLLPDIFLERYVKEITKYNKPSKLKLFNNLNLLAKKQIKIDSCKINDLIANIINNTSFKKQEKLNFLSDFIEFSHHVFDYQLFPQECYYFVEQKNYNNTLKYAPSWVLSMMYKDLKFFDKHYKYLLSLNVKIGKDLEYSIFNEQNEKVVKYFIHSKHNAFNDDSIFAICDNSHLSDSIKDKLIDFFINKIDLKNRDKENRGKIFFDLIKGKNIHYKDILYQLNFVLSEKNHYEFIENYSYSLIKEYLHSECVQFYPESLFYISTNNILSTEEKKELLIQCVENNCDIFYQNHYNENVLFFTTEVEIAQFFINLGLKPNHSKTLNRNVYFSKYTTLKMIDYWAQYGVNINEKDDAGDSILHRYIKDNCPWYVKDNLSKCSFDFIKTYIKNEAELELKILETYILDKELKDKILELNKAALEKRQFEKNIKSFKA